MVRDDHGATLVVNAGKPPSVRAIRITAPASIRHSNPRPTAAMVKWGGYLAAPPQARRTTVPDVLSSTIHPRATSSSR